MLTLAIIAFSFFDTHTHALFSVSNRAGVSPNCALSSIVANHLRCQSTVYPSSRLPSSPAQHAPLTNTPAPLSSCTAISQARGSQALQRPIDMQYAATYLVLGTCLGRSSSKYLVALRAHVDDCIFRPVALIASQAKCWPSLGSPLRQTELHNSSRCFTPQLDRPGVWVCGLQQWLPTQPRSTIRAAAGRTASESATQ